MTSTNGNHPHSSSSPSRHHTECPSPEELSAWIDHRASNPEEIEAHLRSCLQCREIIASYQKIDQQISDHLTAIIRESPEILARIHQTSLEEIQQSSKKSIFLSPSLLTLAYLLILAGIFLVFFYLTKSGNRESLTIPESPIHSNYSSIIQQELLRIQKVKGETPFLLREIRLSPPSSLSSSPSEPIQQEWGTLNIALPLLLMKGLCTSEDQEKLTNFMVSASDTVFLQLETSFQVWGEVMKSFTILQSTLKVQRPSLLHIQDPSSIILIQVTLYQEEGSSP